MASVILNLILFPLSSIPATEIKRIKFEFNDEWNVNNFAQTEHIYARILFVILNAIITFMCYVDVSEPKELIGSAIQRSKKDFNYLVEGKNSQKHFIAKLLMCWTIFCEVFNISLWNFTLDITVMIIFV